MRERNHGNREEFLAHSILFPWLRWCFLHPGWSLAALFAIVALLSLGLGKLRFDPSIDGLVQADSPEVRVFEEFQANFGGETHLLVIAEGENLFRRDVLESLCGFQRSLTTTREVRSVDSLLNLPVVQRYPSRNLVAPLLDAFPSEDEVLHSITKTFRESPLLEGTLISSNGESLVFRVSLHRSRLNPSSLEESATAVSNMADRFAESTPELEVYSLGMATANQEARTASRRDLLLLTPISVLLITTLLFLLFRSWLAVLLPLSTGLLSSVGTLGAMGHAGFEITILLSPIILLVFVLGATEDLHFLSAFFEGKKHLLEGERLLAYVDRRVGTAILLTSTTTVLGFLAVSFVPLEGLRSFGQCAAFAMLLNFLVTIVVIPAALGFSASRKRSASSPNQSERPPWLASLETWLPNFIYRPWLVLFSFAAVSLLFAIGTARLELNTDLISYLPRESETVKSKARYDQSFQGSAQVAIIVETGKRDEVYQSDTLEALEKFHRGLSEQFAPPLSQVSILEQSSDILTQFAPASSDSDSHLSGNRLELARSLLRPRFVDYDGSRSVFYVSSTSSASRYLREFRAEVETLASSALPETFEVNLTGQRMLIATLTDNVSRLLLCNLASFAVLIFVLVSITLRSPLAGLVALASNSFPILATFGLMGLIGAPLSIATFPVTLVAFGLAIDDTIHLLLRHRVEIRLSEEDQVGVRVLRAEILPVLTTSIAVIAGYLLLCFSDFRLNHEVGFLFAWAVFAATLSDLILTPTLLNSLGRFYSQGLRSGQPDKNLRKT